MDEKNSASAMYLLEITTFDSGRPTVIIFGEENSGKTGLLYSFMRQEANKLFKTEKGALPIYFNAREIMPWIETCRAVGGDARPFLDFHELLRYLLKKDCPPFRPTISMKPEILLDLFQRGEINVSIDSLEALADFPYILETLLGGFLVAQKQTPRHVLQEKTGGRIFLCARPEIRELSSTVEMFDRLEFNIRPGMHDRRVFNVAPLKPNWQIIKAPTPEEMKKEWPNLTGSAWRKLQRQFAEEIKERAEREP